MLIRKFKNDDAQKVSQLIYKVFSEFVAPDWSEIAVKECLTEQTAEKILQRSKVRDQYIALESNQIVGFIEGRDNNRISRIFIHKEYQRKSIATALFKTIEDLFLSRRSKKIIVHSSLHAQKYYEKMGFKKSTGFIRSKGMVYQPMIKYLINARSSRKKSNDAKKY